MSGFLLDVGDNCATENSSVLQVFDRRIDLIQGIPVRYEIIQFEFAFAVPANKQRKILLGSTVATARAGEGAISTEQAGIQARFRTWRCNADQ